MSGCKPAIGTSNLDIEAVLKYYDDDNSMANGIFENCWMTSYYMKLLRVATIIMSFN